MAKQESFLMFAADMPEPLELWKQINELEFKAKYTAGIDGELMLWTIGLLMGHVVPFKTYVHELESLSYNNLSEKLLELSEDFNRQPKKY